jgi:predicted neuraminidase
VTLSVATPAAAPWRQCHASTIIEGAEGDLLLAFFAGTREGADDNAIYLVRGVARATWSPAEETDLPNNNSGLCATRLSDGRVVCAHNTSEIPWGPRNELALSVSTDEGRTWTRTLTLDALPPPTSTITPDDAGVDTDGQSELSYPTLIARPEALMVSYTRERREIAVASIALSSLG